uniref:Alpha-N-acetylglucosaminidase n=1 Tax=Heligmosomoides polygyrus TaxID=6339 RepID=A0A8L8JVE4_HELPZ
LKGLMQSSSRNLPRTMHFFENSMEAVTFPYVNKVGLNSRPNGVALWFGKQMEEVDRTLFKVPNLQPDWTYDTICKRYLDNETFLLNEYAERGYKTLLAEDWMQGTLNWPKCWGFDKQPTDHYMRSVFTPYFWVVSGFLCQRCGDGTLAVLGYPKIGWIWLSLLGHDHESGVIHADIDFQRFLLDNKKKVRKKRFIGMVPFLNYCVTRTKLGSLEVNNPLFSISIPKVLRETTDALQMLKENAARLQTHYDIRATLLDILKHQPAVNFTDRTLMEFDGEYGMSLLRSQGDVERTCKNLPIPITYCTCQEPKSSELTHRYSPSAGRPVQLATMEQVRSTESVNYTAQCCRRSKNASSSICETFTAPTME